MLSLSNLVSLTYTLKNCFNFLKKLVFGRPKFTEFEESSWAYCTVNSTCSTNLFEVKITSSFYSVINVLVPKLNQTSVFCLWALYTTPSATALCWLFRLCVSSKYILSDRMDSLTEDFPDFHHVLIEHRAVFLTPYIGMTSVVRYCICSSGTDW